MGVVDGSTNWNGQDNFVDFIQFHAEKLGMTREEYMAHYGSTMTLAAGVNEAKPGPDPYHRGLEDDEVEDKEDQIKKQADMDDDDPDAYKEMPGDKEAREKGEVKTSKATKAYNKLYKEALDEGVMSDIDLMIQNHNSFDSFEKEFFKEYGHKKVMKRTPEFLEWLKALYNDFEYVSGKAVAEANEQQDQMAFSQLERIIDYATMLRDRMAAGQGLDAWMYGKVTKAEDYLNTLYDVVDGDDGVVETQKMTNKDWKKIKKFNKHITDSGEKFVMSYDDRIGTFLEPVEIVEEADDKEQKSTDRGPLDDDKIETALKKKAQDTGVPIGIIRAVMRRGLAAWKSGHRPGANQQQWGYARVNAFLTKGEGTWGNADKDLAKEVRDGGHDKKLKKA